MSADHAAGTSSVEADASGPDGLTVRVRADDGAYYSYHLYRGNEVDRSTPYVRDESHTFSELPPGTYRCRVFVQTAGGDRYAVSGPRVTVAAAEEHPVPATRTVAPPVDLALPTQPDSAWARLEDLPDDSDYSAFLPAVTLWRSVTDFTSADRWSRGVHVITLDSGVHIDLLFGGDLGDIPRGRAVPVIFSGAVSKRNGGPGPFFSGIGLGRGIGSPYVAVSDATLNTNRELALGWYAGRCGDGLQQATLAVLTAVQQRLDRELVLVGGSGGGFAALYNAARLEVPVSAFVWNPQTDLLDYQPSAVEQYLSQALPASVDVVASMSREQRSEALAAGGVAHRVPTDGTAGGRRRVLYLQNAGDAHVITHLAPFVESSGLRHTGDGRYMADDGTLVLVSAFSEGHEAPPRAVLVDGLRAMLDSSISAADVVDDLQRRQVVASTGLETLPRDLRGEADRLRQSVTLHATRDESGQLRATVAWHGLPNRYGGISTAFDFEGRGEPFTRIHRDNAVVVRDAVGGVERVTARVRDGHLHEILRLEAQVTLVPTRVRAFIVGSCVSRDTFAFLDPDHFELAGYVARQSLISAFGPRAAPPVDPAAFTSPFQRRMLEADAASRLPDVLREAAPDIDLVLWDLVDERLGVIEHVDGGVSTDSVELRGHLPEELPSGMTRLAFGSPAHLERFTAALPSWRQLLSELGLLDRTVLVTPEWAAVSDAGEPTPTSFGLDAAEANRLTDVYVERAQSILGVPAVGRFLPSVQASTTHQWGLAPFHYDDWTYERLATEISAVAEQLCRPAGWDETDPHGRTRIPSPGQRGPARVGAPSVTFTQTGPLEVTATVHADEMQACAFSLQTAGRQLSITPYQRSTSHTFTVPEPAIYRCRAFVLRPDGEREPVTSSPLRVV